VSDIERFANAFAGLEIAYLRRQDNTTGSKNSGKIDSRYSIVRETPTRQVFAEHLSEGSAGIGIVPIREDGTCSWGCIDVDEYHIDLPAIQKRLIGYSLPFVVSRSKSGGAHLFLFTDEPVDASLMRRKLFELAAALGYSQGEVFPKQEKLLLERGDIGNALNLPYCSAEASTRYALKPNGSSATLSEFLDLIEKQCLTEAELENLEVTLDEVLEEAPPCLQYLCEQGFPKGTRNNGLFNIGVYLRKAFQDTWEVEIEDCNRRYMDPPLPSSEVVAVIKQLQKKDYRYRCKDQPIISYCDATSCKSRRFGIGPADYTPSFSNLSKFNSDPPLWFLTVGADRLVLQTEDLQNQTKFQRACMEALNMMPPKMGERGWQALVQKLLDKVEIIDVPQEVSIQGQFLNLLEAFCTDRAQAQTRDELMLGKPWTSEARTYFRLKDLLDYCSRQNFKQYNHTQMASKLSDIGGEHKFFNLKGKGVNVYHVAEFMVDKTPYVLPELKQDKEDVM